MTISSQGAERRSDAHIAVSTALALQSANNVASTGAILRQARKLSPFCQENDEELVALVVSLAAQRNIAVSFDHRDT
jgi:hypothetical protein